MKSNSYFLPISQHSLVIKFKKKELRITVDIFTLKRIMCNIIGTNVDATIVYKNPINMH